MNTVPTVPAVLAALGLLVLPGLAFLLLLPRRARDALRLDEALYLATASAVAAAAWLALLLAELGRFSLPTGGALLGLASVGALLVGRRRLGSWPRWPGARSLAPAGLVLALALVVQARSSEYIVGGRDPGAYLATMGLIARTGSLIYTDPGVLSLPAEDVGLFYRHPELPDFSWGRFLGFHLENPKTGRVFPQFFHLFPAFGAYLFHAMGPRGALATPAIFGVLGTLGVFMAGRRIFGDGVALLATVFLSLNVVQVWFSRYPVAEGLSQFLIFFGLLAFALWEETEETVFGALAGAAMGLTLLARIDAVLILPPICLWLVARRAQRRLSWRRAATFLVPFALVAAHAVVHAVLFAWPYLEGIATRPYWKQPAWLWALLAVLGVASLAVLDRLGPRIVALIAGRGRLGRQVLFLAACALAAYAYFLRPQLSAWAGADGNPVASSRTNFSALDSNSDKRLSAAELDAGAVGDRLERFDRDGDGTLEREEWPGVAPWPLDRLGFQRLAAHDAQSLVRLGWAVTPLGLLLSLGGLGVLMRRWRPRALLLLLAALPYASFYLYKVRVFNDYPFAWRRFLPVLIPVLMLLAALALVGIARAPGWRRWAATALAFALAGSYARETVRIAGHVEWRGSVAFVRDLARRFGPDDVLIFEQPRSIHLLSLPLWAHHGVNALQLARFNPDPEQLQHLVAAWRHTYRNIYFVHTYNTDLCGLFLERVEDRSFHSEEWFSYDTRPVAPEPRSLHFTISRVIPPEQLQVPPLSSLDIGKNDDVQVSGFHDKEGGEERTFRWTGRCASVYLPALAPGARVTLTASAGHRPADDPARVSVRMGQSRLGEFTAGPEWEDHTFTMPDPLPEGPCVLRLDVPGWRPVDSEAGSRDIRDLGVMLDRIHIEPPAVESRSEPGGGS